MKISVFSKFEMCGGSELRSVELANGIAKFTGHESVLLAEKSLSAGLRQHIDPKVKVVENSLAQPECFYKSHAILVINTDVPDFSTLDYWLGKSPRHSYCLDMTKMAGKKMLFIYNFLISPSRHLYQLADQGLDICILPTNRKFFDEITKQDRYEQVRLLPRQILQSPIDQSKINTFVRSPSESVCFGCHSKHFGDKWNDELTRLVIDLKKKYEDRVTFRFMGITGELRKKMDTIPGVTCLKENEEPVRDFISKLDVFLFFPHWKREEPWARVIAEAMVAGCPIIALDKGGTCDQVLNYHNGFLCKDYKDYFRHSVYVVEHPNVIETMSKNSIRLSKSFYAVNVIQRLVGILENSGLQKLG
jgi:hypothetical protein